MAPRHRSVATRLSPALIDLVQRRDLSIIGLLPISRHRVAELPDWASCRKNVREDAKRSALDV
jgi:hypothetical protein